jgi:pimeloyl-ACP methyl ester carboxylesterase
VRDGARQATRLAAQRARLARAEVATFEHFGIEVTSERLALRDPETTVRVVRCGAGPPAVLLHGGGMTAAVWAPLLPHLPGRSLHLVDLPGCGLSDPFDYTGVDVVAQQEAFAGSVLDALDLPRAPLVGSSLGGMFALRFALRAPARVSALVLLGAPAVALAGARVPLAMAVANTGLGMALTVKGPPPSGRMTRRMLATMGGDGEPPDAPDVFYDALGAATSIAAPTLASLSPQLFRWRTPHARVSVPDAQLAGCQVPVQLIWGDDDRVQPPEAGFRAAAVLPDARVEVLPGGHGIWVDQPSRCGALLTGFLDEVEQPSPQDPHPG